MKNNTKRFVKKQSPKKVMFTLSTGIVDASRWEELDSLTQKIGIFCRAHGTGQVNWRLSLETPGVSYIWFVPYKTDLDLLKNRIEAQFDCSVFRNDTANTVKEVEEKENDI